MGEPRLPSIGAPELVLLQATPFCNVDCDYCYLEGRTNRGRMTDRTLDRIARFLSDLPLSDPPPPLVWHVGEPLVLPVGWFENAHHILAEGLRREGLEFHFQTNATRIDAGWTDYLLRDERLRIGVSIDGPRDIHDARRKTRSGGGTHALAMRGANLLKEARIPFHCVTVISEPALRDPDGFYAFFAELQPTILGLNPEELEGANARRTGRQAVFGVGGEHRYRGFLRRLFERHLTEPKFQIREVMRVEAQVEVEMSGRAMALDGNRLNMAGRILSFDWEGNVHSFAPELLGVDLPGVGAFLGNVHRDSWASIIASPKFLQLRTAIEAGTDRCREGCNYFNFCGGGSPANKWFENGDFSSTETEHCRLAIQAPLDEYVRLATVRESALHS